MNIKINIVNDKFCKMSPLAFGTLFSNFNEYTYDENPIKFLENIGCFIGKRIRDYEGNEYKVLGIDKMNEFENRSEGDIYKFNIRRLAA